MKLLFDQNLSPRLPASLAVEYPGFAHLRCFGMATAPDPAVWAFAAAGGYVIVSKDSDFEQGRSCTVTRRRWSGCGWRTARRRRWRTCYARLPDLLAFEADPTLAILVLR